LAPQSITTYTALAVDETRVQSTLPTEWSECNRTRPTLYQIYRQSPNRNVCAYTRENTWIWV